MATNIAFLSEFQKTNQDLGFKLGELEKMGPLMSALFLHAPMFCESIPKHAPRRETFACKNEDSVNQGARTYELLISDVQGHVAERGGDGAHHAVVVYSEQLHEDGQTFLLPDGRSDVH